MSFFTEVSTSSSWTRPIVAPRCSRGGEGGGGTDLARADPAGDHSIASIVSILAQPLVQAHHQSSSCSFSRSMLMMSSKHTYYNRCSRLNCSHISRYKLTLIKDVHGMLGTSFCLYFWFLRLLKFQLCENIVQLWKYLSWIFIMNLSSDYRWILSERKRKVEMGREKGRR